MKPSDARYRRKVRRAIAERDDGLCQICGDPVDKAATAGTYYAATLDHILPVCDGGDWSEDNLRLAHYGCNYARHHG